MWSVFLPHPQDPHSLPYLPTPTGRWSLHCFATDGPWPRETVFARTKDCGISKIKGGFTPKSRSQKMKYCNWFEVKSIIWLIFNQPLYIKSVSISLDHFFQLPQKKVVKLSISFFSTKKWPSWPWASWMLQLKRWQDAWWEPETPAHGAITGTLGLRETICWGSVPLLKDQKKKVTRVVFRRADVSRTVAVWKLWVQCLGPRKALIVKKYGWQKFITFTQKFATPSPWKVCFTTSKNSAPRLTYFS